MPELIDRAKLLEYLAAIKPDEYVSAYGSAVILDAKTGLARTSKGVIPC